MAEEYKILHHVYWCWQTVTRVYGMYTLNEAKKVVEEIKEEAGYKDLIEIVKVIESFGEEEE